MTRKALVVGINRYPCIQDAKGNRQDLTYPAADAEAIAQLLRKYGHFEVKLLPETFSEDAFQMDEKGLVKEDVLMREISELFNPTSGNVPETALLFFAGHGFEKPLPRNKVEGYFATSDSNPKKGKWGIRFHWLLEELVDSPIRNQIVWLDCCHSGTFTNLTFAQADPENRGHPNVNRLFIAACRESKTAYGIKGHGLLTTILLRGLNPHSDPVGQWINSKNLDAFINDELRNDSALSTFQQRFRTHSSGEPINFWLRLGLQNRKTPSKGEIVEPSDPSFVGRESAIAHLNDLIQTHKIILIHAEGGIGKTTLAKRFLKQFDTCIECSIAKETQNITSVESLVEEKLRQLGEEPGREFGISLDRLKEKLKAERIAVLIDNLEPALEGGKFIEPHRGYLELLRILADPDVQSVTLITSRECLREAGVTVYPYKLKGLNLEAWQEYFSSKDIPKNTEVLTQMHKAYGGNAKAMEILCGGINEDYEGDIEAYWNANKDDLLIEPDLEDLVISQFNRLQQQDKAVYNLLCRLGCYRYQDVPSVPEDGVCVLLWDVDEGKRRRVIKSLKDRALVEHSKDEYWLHPVIRAEAIKRLRESGEDWEKANIKAAEFWSPENLEIKNKDKALNFLEGFHHYCQIEDYQKSYDILSKKTSIVNSNRSLRHYLRYWGYSVNLISCFNKLQGKLEKYNDIYIIGGKAVCYYYINNYEKSISLFESGLKMMSANPNTYEYCKPYPEYLQYLGKNYLRLGMLKRAIYFCDNALEQLENIQRNYRSEIKKDKDIHVKEYNYFHRIRSNILQTLAEIYQDLAEYDTAIQKAHQSLEVLRQISANLFYRDEADTLAMLAICFYANSEIEEAIDTMEEALKKFQSIEDRQSEGYARCYLANFYSHENLNKVQEHINWVEANLEQQNDRFLKARLLEQKARLERINNNYDDAIQYHTKSIKVSRDICEKCSLAEAYYQRGLTYQKIGDIENSEKDLNTAIELYEQMEAPRQIEKVQKAKNQCTF